MRRVPALCSLVAGATLALAPGAAADRRSAFDERTGVAFGFDGRSLTVRVRPGPEAGEVRKQVFGEDVDVICSTSYYLDRGLRARGTLRWPVGVHAVTFVLDRDISRDVKTCLLEAGGPDVADVGFGPAPAILLVQVHRPRGARPAGRARRHLRLRDARGRPVLQQGGSTLGPLLLEPGFYELTRWERRCRASCRLLGPPVVRCARRLGLRSGQRLAVLVTLDYERGRCRITTSRLDEG